MAKKGRPKLWENCSKQEHQEVYEIEKNYLLLRKDLEKRLITKKQYRSKVKKLIKMLDEVEMKYQ